MKKALKASSGRYTKRVFKVKYLGYFKIAFKNRFASRALNLLWVIAKPIEILVAITVWTAIYEYSGQGVIKGFTLDQTINYMIFSLIFGAIAYTKIGAKLGSHIKSGRLNTMLVKPVDYGLNKLSQVIGARVHAVIFEVLPGVVIAVLFFGFHQYNSLMTLLAITSMSLALLVNYFFSLSWALIYFKTINFESIEWFKKMLISILSGSLIPLNFLPIAFQEVLKYLPFQFLSYIPSRIFINSYPLQEVILLLMIQASWIVLLYAVYKIGWNYSIKSFSGVGA